MAVSELVMTSPIFATLCFEKALFLSIIISLLLIFCLHFKASFKHRDNTDKIKERFRRSAIATVLVTIVLLACALKYNDNNTLTVLSFLKMLGFLPENFAYSFLLTFSAVIALFLGNFVISFADCEFNLEYVKSDIRCVYFLSENGHLRFYRNYLVAPAVEEFIYRACIVPLMFPTLGWKTVIFAPMLFGFAHLHHGYELYKLGYNIRPLILKVSFQFIYTTIFGSYCAFLFIVYENLYLIWAVHAFCNLAGFPDLGQVFNPQEMRKSCLYFSIYIAGVICFTVLNVNYIYKPLSH